MLLTNASDLVLLIEFNYSAVTSRIVMYKICGFVYVELFYLYWQIINYKLKKLKSQVQLL
jgi:hypothetical protein